MTTTIGVARAETRVRSAELRTRAPVRFSPPGWIDVCNASAIPVETGVCAHVGRDQVAVFRLHDGRLLAVGNEDPFSGAAVLSRGIVGDSHGVPKVSSPLYKQAFDLRSGVCLDDPTVRIPVYPVRTVGETVQVQACPMPTNWNSAT